MLEEACSPQTTIIENSSCFILSNRPLRRRNDQLVPWFPLLAIVKSVVKITAAGRAADLSFAFSHFTLLTCASLLDAWNPKIFKKTLETQTFKAKFANPNL